MAVSEVGTIALDGPWCKPIYFDVSWLVDYLYIGFAGIFPAEKILYEKRHKRKQHTITHNYQYYHITSLKYLDSLSDP